jgi:hypothetical protein
MASVPASISPKRKGCVRAALIESLQLGDPPAGPPGIRRRLALAASWARAAVARLGGGNAHERELQNKWSAHAHLAARRSSLSINPQGGLSDRRRIPSDSSSSASAQRVSTDVLIEHLIFSRQDTGLLSDRRQTGGALRSSCLATLFIT